RQEGGGVAWGGGGDLPEAPQQHLGVARVEDELRVPDVTDLVGLELEGRDDAEVAARAPDRPEQVRVLGLVGPHHRAVGEDDLGRAETIDGEALPAAEQPDPGGGGQAADADSAVVAGGQRPSAGPQGGGDVLPARAGSDADAAGGLVEHLHGVHAPQVDDDAAVVGGPAADAVPAAANPERQVRVAAGEGERVDDLGGGPGPQH